MNNSNEFKTYQHIPWRKVNGKSKTKDVEPEPKT